MYIVTRTNAHYRLSFEANSNRIDESILVLPVCNFRCQLWRRCILSHKRPIRRSTIHSDTFLSISTFMGLINLTWNFDIVLLAFCAIIIRPTLTEIVEVHLDGVFDTIFHHHSHGDSNSQQMPFLFLSLYGCIHPRTPCFISADVHGFLDLSHITSQVCLEQSRHQTGDRRPRRNELSSKYA